MAPRRSTVGALLALGLAAACTVTTTGAPCTTDANCPTGQGCGGDGACGAAALECPGYVPGVGVCRVGTSCDASGKLVPCTSTGGVCAVAQAPQGCPPPQTCQGAAGEAACRCPPAGVDAGQGCATAGAEACVGARWLRCAASAGCQVWSVAADCGSSGLVCGATAVACACPANDGPDFLADAVAGSPAGASPAPTGVASPAACRFRSLTDALAAAGASTRTGRAVRASGWASGAAMVFSEANGEAFPIRVPAGVALTPQDGVPGHYAIQPASPVPSAGGVAPVVALEEGAGLAGFGVRPGPSASASDALLIACGAATGATTRLADLDLEGTASGGSAPSVDDGIQVSGPCSVELSRVAVTAFARAGVRVEVSGAASIALTEGSIRGCGDTGLVVAASGIASVRITGQEITGNRGSTPRGTASRTVGGVLFLGAKPATLAFAGNRVYGNKGDQVMVFSSFGSAADPWNLAGGTACSNPPAAPNNVIACYDPAVNGSGAGSGPGVGVIQASSGVVNARFNSWTDYPPVGDVDYLPGTGGVVDAIGAGNDFCAAATVTCPP
jgi:hypothetical protein